VASSDICVTRVTTRERDFVHNHGQHLGNNRRRRIGMADRNGQRRQITVEDRWLLDHHIEEVLDTIIVASAMRDRGRDADEQRFDVAIGDL
jgi:hypothetical protein